ncbi:hypothetical protein TNCV_2662301 [Trichonephila clavipes]|nr:hypothetical protein TNCV_2662301 [Trichonephila clavipes]
MAYYYGTTHQNVINCSSMDLKTLRFFGSSPIGHLRRKTFYTDFISKDVNATVKGGVRTFVTEFRPVTHIQRRVRTEWNVVTCLPNRLIGTPTK